MKRSRRLLAPALCSATALAIVLTLGAGSAIAKKGDGRPVDKVVMFASDGMRPDLMEKYANAGFMPTYKALMKNGVTGDNGMVQAFPPNTGVGWYTMATGTYPSEHGSTNNTFFRSGDTFSNRTSFSGAGVLQADTIANAAERAGKKVAQIDWVGGAAANINGPTVDFTNFFSNRGVLVGAADPVEQAGSNFFGVTYQVASVVPAAGWTGVPTGDPAATPKETTWTINSTFAAQNPNRTYNVYFYDSVTGGGVKYDHAIVSPVGKTGASPSIDLKVGDFLPIKLTGANGLIGARAGQTVGHYIKLISLAPDASQFKLYDTSLARAIAKCGTVVQRPACRRRRRGSAREVHRRQPPAVGRSRLRAGGSGRGRRGHLRPAGPRPRAGLQPPGDQLHPRDAPARHQPRDGRLPVHGRGLAPVHGPRHAERPRRHSEPLLRRHAEVRRRPVHGSRHRRPRRDPRGLHPQRLPGRRREARRHARADGRQPDDVRRLRPRLRRRSATRSTRTRCCSTPPSTTRSTNADVSLHASNANASNCGAATTDLAKACWAGGTIQIYVNSTLAGRHHVRGRPHRCDQTPSRT